MNYNPAPFVCVLFLLIPGFLFARLPGSKSQLLVAVRHNDTNAIANLIRKGANVNGKAGTRAMTPLMIAASEGNEEAVRTLLQLGATKYARNSDGKSAAQIAAEAGRTNTLSLLRTE
jgi:ankyrin repeat protein